MNPLPNLASWMINLISIAKEIFFNLKHKFYSIHFNILCTKAFVCCKIFSKWPTSPFPCIIFSPLSSQQVNSRVSKEEATFRKRTFLQIHFLWLRVVKELLAAIKSSFETDSKGIKMNVNASAWITEDERSIQSKQISYKSFWFLMTFFQLSASS